MRLLKSRFRGTFALIRRYYSYQAHQKGQFRGFGEKEGLLKANGTRAITIGKLEAYN